MQHRVVHASGGLLVDGAGFVLDAYIFIAG
jgi:hypothetical protein